MLLFSRTFFLLVVVSLVIMSCSQQQESDPVEDTAPLFSRLTPERTGIAFANVLSEHPTPRRNVLLYEYFYNGAGVAIGDVNGDGLEDVYFTGNMVYNKLYLNRGGLRFEDVTQNAGVGGRKDTWKTGVSMADVNGDGLLDIYVCYSGDLPLERRVDELYINQGVDARGIPQFQEQAAAYGLANPHSSNQAYFFDYDRDGDLDLFLLTHNVKNLPRLDADATRVVLETEDPVSGVRMYRQDGGQFVDVTLEAGIKSSSLTYGLGAGIADINKDGWLDMYVGNDYSPPDYLYINNGDGTFTDRIREQTGHTSSASMGVDAADLNNDLWPDIVVADMLAEDNQRQKRAFLSESRSLFDLFIRSGFHYQYHRNTLQLNNGNGTFSEIGQLAGISNTDWSWSTLIADFDNDGNKDLYISNGYQYDTTDRDFLALKNDYVAANPQLQQEDVALLMNALPPTVMYNYMFRNEGGSQKGALRFEDVSDAWGLRDPLLTTGAAYVDLDNDGDLDLVTNNNNEYAFIYENKAHQRDGHHYIQLALEGEGGNSQGIGAQVTLYAGATQQYRRKCTRERVPV